MHTVVAEGVVVVARVTTVVEVVGAVAQGTLGVGGAVVDPIVQDSDVARAGPQESPKEFCSRTSALYAMSKPH